MSICRTRLTVAREPAVYAQLYGVRDAPRAHRRAGRGSATCDALLDRRSGSLSAGQKTRVGVAKALLNQPEVLLLDEPTASLDPDTGDWVRTYLERYRARARRTILLASHNMAEVERLCHDVLMMKAGQHRRPRRAGRADRALRPRHARGGVPRHRPRPPPARADGRAMTRQGGWHATAVALRRIGAILLRHSICCAARWPRLFDLVYWPTAADGRVGLHHQFLAANSSWVVQAGGVLIGGVLLWDVLVRGQFGMTLSLLEEMWSRNLGQPVRQPACGRSSSRVALMVLSMLRSLIGVMPAALLAIPMFAFSIFDLGLPLIAFWAVLIMFGWGVGLMISAALIRFGLAAESYAWASIFVLAPVSGVYYPIDTLPAWLRAISWALPSTHVFEGMRAVMIDNVFRWDLMASALGLNVIYLAAGLGLFLLAFESARQRGQLLHAGE